MITAILISILAIALLMIQINRTELLKLVKEKEQNLDLVTREMVRLEERNNEYLSHLQQQKSYLESVSKELELQKEQTALILSQKKSSETRLGQIGENLVPFLEGFPYDAKAAHFLGNPIDYLIFDLASHDPAIIFLEIKTGNSKLSNNQKMIRNLITSGKVRFEEIRLNEKGIKLKGTPND
jgi:predicted Holliday junction resolvase-like endonuclease